MSVAHKRLALVSLLGLLIAGGGVGLAVVLGQSHARGLAQVRHSAEDRAALAAALINSVFEGDYDAAAPTDGPVSQARVTNGEILAARRHSPLTAVVGSGGRVLASHPALSPATRRLIAVQPAVRTALTDGRHHLSGLLPATPGAPAGLLDVAPFRTPYGLRATVTWLPLATMGAALDRYLRYVASYTGRQHGAQVFLLDSHDAVVGSADGGLRGQRLSDGALLSAVHRDANGSRFGPGGSRFFAAARLSIAPWTVVYTAPTGFLFASQGADWRLSVLLLAGFLAAAAVCLALLVGLLRGSDKLAHANAALELRNDQLRGATEAKSRFVASMAHELRTPLSAVLGFSELMQVGRAGPMNETQTEYLGIVRSSADHLLLLINDALDLATVEAGQLTLRPEAIDPALVARECVEAVRWLADARDVRVAFAAEDRGRVSLDPGRLRQVILNLLSNAIKFSDAGGRVTVRLAREDGRLTISVSDEGIGIPPADLERVFDEFVQLGDGDHAGSGLGLAVTREIVQAQGGEVGVWSRVGAGSTFTAWLPWRSPQVSRPAQAEGDAPRAWRSRPRIPSSQRSG